MGGDLHVLEAMFQQETMKGKVDAKNSLNTVTRLLGACFRH